MPLSKLVTEENKLNEVDLEVIACAGATIEVADVVKRTGLAEQDVRTALMRAATVLPTYLAGLLAQVKDPDLSPTHRQMAAQASQSMSAVVEWVRRLSDARSPGSACTTRMAA